MGSYSLLEGERLVKAARQSIELKLMSPHFKREMIDKELEGFDEPQGVFVTIGHYSTKALRGSMGYPRATLPLKDSLIEAATAAATKDSRFLSLSHMEFEHVVIEVSLLSKPEPIRAKTSEKIKREIEIGRHGLLIQSGFRQGLILPNVPVEKEWGKEEMLENLCVSAGLHRDAWKDSNVTLHKFTAQTFREILPRDGVEEVIPGN